MRLRFEFAVTKEEIPLDYRRCLISLFKKALEKNNLEAKDKYYHKADPIQKAFTFSVFFKNPKFHKDYIELEDKKVILNFSTYSYELGINYYNALLSMVNYAHDFGDDNYLILKNITLVKEKQIKSEEVSVKTLAPILVRKHDKIKNIDTYLMPNDDGFMEHIRVNLRQKLESLGLEDLKNQVDTFEIKDVCKSKEVKVLFYGHKVEASISKFTIRGKSELLDFVAKAGIGSRTSSGFGMMEVEGVN